VQASVIVDGFDAQENDEPFSTAPETAELPIDVPFSLGAGGILFKSLDLQQFGQWRTLQVQLQSDAGKLSLNRMGVTAFIDSYVVQQ